jgi:hypothetical protein
VRFPGEFVSAEMIFLIVRNICRRVGVGSKVVQFGDSIVRALGHDFLLAINSYLNLRSAMLGENTLQMFSRKHCKCLICCSDHFCNRAHSREFFNLRQCRSGVVKLPPLATSVTDNVLRILNQDWSQLHTSTGARRKGHGIVIGADIAEIVR